MPGAVAAVGTAEGRCTGRRSAGLRSRPTQARWTEDDLFDLASLTKIVVTTTLLLRYLEQGRLFLEQPLASSSPPSGTRTRTGRAGVTLRHLLTHTSGLPAWKDLRPDHRDGRTPPAPPGLLLSKRRSASPSSAPPGVAVVYSDLGYIALGTALSTIGAPPSTSSSGTRCWPPWRWRAPRTSRRPVATARCVATEDIPDRGGVLPGIVHDDNAGAMGGVAGHAGLFATCADLERFCRMWLGMGTLEGRRDGVPFLSPATVRLATRDQTSQAYGPARVREGETGGAWGGCCSRIPSGSRPTSAPRRPTDTPAIPGRRSCSTRWRGSSPSC